MRVIHNWLGKNIEKETRDDAGFLLTDQRGGWFCLWSKTYSRYGGWFVSLHQKHYKIIEDIVLASGAVEEIKNNFWCYERKRGELYEKFFLPVKHRALVYEVSQTALIDLVLDFKLPYENQDYANYEIVEQDGRFLVVQCSLKGTENVFLAFYADTPNYFPMRQTVWKDYPLDRERRSPPFGRNVYRLMQYEGRKIVMAVDLTKEQAKKEALFIFKNTSKFEKEEQGRIKVIFDKLPQSGLSEELQMALRCCANALSGFGVDDPYGVVFYAGLPWFFQFWTRDALIALKEYWPLNEKLGEKIYWHLAHKLRSLGFLPNITSGQSGNHQESSDGLGWLAARTMNLEENGYLKTLTTTEMSALKNILLEAIHGIIKNHSQDGLIVSPSSTTWMDSLTRDGFRIEIQSLTLALFSLAHRLTHNNYYWLLETELKNRVRERFWNDKVLLDGWRDFTVRPNIFLAAYAYPTLLNREEWIRSFTSALPKLWLEWGGLSTVDTKSLLFNPEHSGESSVSYHNGDSWFFLNNLAALILTKADAVRFRYYVDKIVQASTKEILWQGVIGHHAELSSANRLKSQGCWSQAWSASAYGELIKALAAK